jgi:hypothetical protein
MPWLRGELGCTPCEHGIQARDSAAVSAPVRPLRGTAACVHACMQQASRSTGSEQMASIGKFLKTQHRTCCREQAMRQVNLCTADTAYGPSQLASADCRELRVCSAVRCFEHTTAVAALPVTLVCLVVQCRGQTGTSQLLRCQHSPCTSLAWCYSQLPHRP